MTNEAIDRYESCPIEAETISKSYVAEILAAGLLAPDVVETILEGRSDQALMLERLERPLPASWEEQRRHPMLA